MNSIDYRHNAPPSSRARLIQVILSLYGMKRKVNEKIALNTFDKDPAVPARSSFKKHSVQESELFGRKVWEIHHKEIMSDVLILFLHGGAYMANITRLHWDLIGQLADKTDAVIVVPDYPLAPESRCREVYAYLGLLYSRLTDEYPAHRINFIGDSAGAGLALGFVQYLRNENIKQPDQIILFSPWLDVTMSNPGLEPIQSCDKILSIEGLRSAGQKYAGDLDVRDFRVSPVYGDLSGLCPVSIFTGTNDILNADARKIMQLMKDQGISLNYYEYPGMFHDWVLVRGLKESRDAVDKVCQLLSDCHLTIDN